MTAPRRPIALVALLAVFLMAGEWMLLVWTTNLHEMIVGGISVLASGGFLWHAHRCERLRMRFQIRDVLAVWRLPWDVVRDAWQILVVLLKDLAGHRADSLYRVCGFVTAKDDPTLIARRVLATIYSTASPNSIVIGVDYHKSRVLFHQIERSGVPKMMQALGAKP